MVRVIEIDEIPERKRKGRWDEVFSAVEALPTGKAVFISREDYPDLTYGKVYALYRRAKGQGYNIVGVSFNKDNPWVAITK